MEFRIKIVEKRNGEKRYVPQAGTPRLRIGRFDFLSIDWENIINRNGHFTTMNMMSESHSTEKEALKIIEDFKKYCIEEEGRETKQIYYKKVD